MNSLDLFSTSPTYPEDCAFKPCKYRAPFFAYQKQNKMYGVTQGCCNHWDCPRCGIIRAKQEYGRIIEGIKTLAETDKIWFITITCLGRELSTKDSEANYGIWTNRLLDAWRLQAKRNGQKWSYVQVTERQKRGHPHSHILTTFSPNDTISHDWKSKRVLVGGRGRMAYVQAYRSEYIQQSVIRSGLGEQYDISPAATVGGVARYVAKYLFKSSIFDTKWPKGWKRVRYAQSFPKMERKTTDAFVLIKKSDWQKLAELAVIVTVKTPAEREEAEFWLKGSDIVLLTK